MFARPGFLQPPSSAAGAVIAHASYPTGQIHAPFNWVVADTAARNAIVPAADDVYKALWQISNNSAYILTSYSPIRWAVINTRVLKSYSEEVLADTPNIYFRMGETSGTAATNAGSTGTAGTYTGAWTLNQTGFVPGGKSVSFPGTTQNRLASNITTNYSAACTIEFFFSPVAGSQASAKLVDKVEVFAETTSDFPIQVYWDGVNNKVGFQLANSADFTADVTLLSGALTLGSDYHVVCKYQAGSIAEMWINGVLVASASHSITIATNTRMWAIGAASVEFSGGANTTAFKGRIGEVAIYDKALSGTRIVEHYEAKTIV